MVHRRPAAPAPFASPSLTRSISRILASFAMASFLPGFLAAVTLAPFQALAAGDAAAAGAGAPPTAYFARVYLDGHRVSMPAPAMVLNDALVAPVRALFEKLGATVTWDGTSRVTVKTGSKAIDLWLGQDWASVDGESVHLNVAPFRWKSTVMVPVRLIAETMGQKVIWDRGRRAAFLSPDTEDSGGSGGQSGTGGQGGEGSAPPPVREITLAFAGDTLLGFRIGDIIAANGVDYVWGGVSEVLRGADLAMVNLETSVSLRGSPMPNKKWTFRAKPESLQGLKNAGVDVVSIANNHVLDFGQEAFGDTISYLNQYGIEHVGGGLNLNAAIRPVILEANGFKVGFLAATAIYPVNEWVATDSRPGVLPTHYEAAVMKAVADLKRQVDFVVVGVHWGTEREHHAGSYQQRYGRALIDAGADIVVGHHPHVLQGMEVYKGRLIAYSLGNFIFTTATRDGQDSGIFRVTLDEEGVAAAQLLPVYTDAGRPVLESGADHDRILASLNEWSAGWGTTLDPTGFVMIP